ncbi:hypothetical protein BIWAKO_00018 [Bosea sp. BIWAKO-01]|nr:hypothetical protein BIWAKO_00018 [Bosea sp. BIWAKO-01]
MLKKPKHYRIIVIRKRSRKPGWQEFDHGSAIFRPAAPALR